MLTEWENKNGIHTEHVNVYNNDDVEKKLANHEIDCFVSLEESIWSEQGISSVTTVGKSGIYFVINKERSDIKTAWSSGFYSVLTKGKLLHLLLQSMPPLFW